MKRHVQYMRACFLMLLVGSSFAASSQCAVTISSNSPVTCGNKTVNFSVGFNVATTFDFNNAGLPAGWSSTAYTVGMPCVTQSPDNSNYFWASATAGVRYVQTSAVNVTAGGNIVFKMRFGSDDPANGCEDPEQVTEGVKLQYSLNGTTWTNIQQWNPDGSNVISGPLFVWTTYTVPIPAAAQTANTIFRWVQEFNDGVGFDNWGLDDIIVQAGAGAISTYAWDFGDGGTSTTAAPSHTYTSYGSYTALLTATFTGPACTASTTAPVNVVQDITVPTLSCPGNQAFNVVANTCAANYTIIDPVTDNCSGATWGYTRSGAVSGSVSGIADGTGSGILSFPKGVTTVALSGTDAFSNAASGCSFTVTVTDNQNPAIIAPAAVSVPADAGVCTASGVALGSPTGSDNCGTVTYSSNAPAIFPKGNTTVTWTATDGSNLTATATQIVTVTDNQAPTFNGLATSVPATVLANVPEASQYRLVYSLNIPNSAAYASNAVAYSVNNASALASATFGRVAYYMELDNKWVWVSMNKFNPTVLPAQLGVPVAQTFQQNVSAMNVLSSSNAGVTNGTNIATGNIEFWNNCYAAPNAQGIPGGSATLYDFADERAAAQPNCYGSFQVHNFGAAQTLFAYNQWATGNGNSDLGIGTKPGPSNATTSNPDWTFSQNAASYTTKRVYVLINGANVLPPVNATTDAGQCSAAIIVPAPAASDNCPAPTVSGVRSDSQPLSAPYPKGATTITWTASDGTLSTVATQLVTVTDNKVPTIAAPAAVSASTGTGLCTASGVALGTPTGSDNCGTITFTNNAPAVFPKGNTTVIWTATDGSSNTATSNQIVTVTDNEAPTLLCPSSVVINVVPNTCAGTYTIADPISDNCTGATWGYIRSGASASTATGIADGTASAALSFAAGLTTVALSGTDGTTGAAGCSFTVTVNESTPPSFSSGGAPVTQVAVLGQSSTTIANYLNANGYNATAFGSTIPTAAVLATYQGVVLVRLPGNSTLEAWVNAGGRLITEWTASVWALNTAHLLNATDDNTGDYVATGTAITLAAGPIGSGLGAGLSNPYSDGPRTEYFRNFTAIGAGVQVVGTRPTATPAILAGPSGAGYTIILGYDWSDDFPSGSSVSGTVLKNALGLSPSPAACPSNITVNASAGLCSAPVTYATPIATDNCTAVSVLQTAGLASGSSFPKGPTTNTFIATDFSGNQATCTFTVTVNDNQPPVVTCPASSSVNVVPASCAGNYTIADPLSDNCTGATWGYVVSGQTASTVSGIADGSGTVVSLNKGLNTIVLNGTDGTNPAVTCSFSITVVDNQAPTFSAPAAVTVNGYCGPGAPAADVSLGTPSNLADNCGTAGLTTGNNAPATFFPVGTTTVTWTVSDGTNSTTHTQLVTVNSLALTATSAVAPLYPLAGQEIQTVYLGYPGCAQSETITMTPGNGTAPYTYSWTRSACNGAGSFTSIQTGTSNSYAFTPAASDICTLTPGGDNVFTFNVIATDAHGCSTGVPQVKKINVVNPYSGADVMVCHRNVSRGSTTTQMMTLAPSAVATHLAHGDYLGNCLQFTGGRQVAAAAVADNGVHVYPNPTTGSFKVELQEIIESADIVVTDVQGKVIARRTLSKDASPVAEFNLSSYSAGMYLISVKDGEMVYRTKIVLR